MKGILRALLILSSLVLLIGCTSNDQTEETQYEVGAIQTPFVMHVDSSDGDIFIPLETDADIESVVWSSSNESIATVDQDGKISIQNEGEVTITAQSGIHESSTRLITSIDKYEDYLRIRTKAEFLMIFSNPDQYSNPENKFVLTKDIDFGGDLIEPIGGWDQSDEETPVDLDKAFRATLDGRGYALINFRIENSRSTKVDQYYFGVSLFPFIYGGTVVNLNLINATFSGSGFTGSLAGKISHGLIENCFVQGTISATLGNNSIPSGGIAGIIGVDAIVRNVLLDVKVSGGFIYSGFNFGTGSNSSAISETLDDEDRRWPIRNTAVTTNNGNEEEDAALNDFLISYRIENEQLGNMDAYGFTEDAKDFVWAFQEGYMPYLIRQDGLAPSWARIEG